MENNITVLVEKMFDDVILPEYKLDGDSGMDVCAYFTDESLKEIKMINDVLIDENNYILLHPGSRTVIPTGLKVTIPNGYEIQVRPRSGMAIREGLTVLNTPGTIDSGYRNEIGIILFNSSTSGTIKIKHGDRIAQLVLQKVPKIKWEIIDKVPDSERGERGFGSTGKN